MAGSLLYSNDWLQALNFWNSLQGEYELVPSTPPLSPEPDSISPINGSLCYNSKPQLLATCYSLPRPSFASTRLSLDPALTCCLLNTRSLVKHGVEVADYITENNLDIMFIAETWLHEAANASAQLATPSGYTTLRSDRLEGIGGGVACIFKDTLDLYVSKTEILTGCEHLFLKVSVNHSTTLFCLIIYRPPPDLPCFNEQLVGLVSHSLKPGSKMLICGDFNYWHNNPTDKEGTKVSDSLSALGFIQHVEKPTNNHGNILDWVLSHNVDITAPEVRPCPWSDHHTVHFSIPVIKLIQKPKYNRVTRMVRDTMKISQTAFEDLVTSQLPIVDKSQDADSLATALHSLLTITTDTLMPLKQKTCKTEARNKAWFSEDILVVRNLKRRAEMTWRRSPNEISKEAYRQAAVTYKKLIIESKAKHYNNRILEAKSSAKELFVVVKELEGATVTQSMPQPTKEWCQSIQDALFGKVDKHVKNITLKLSSLTKPVFYLDPSDSHCYTDTAPTFSFRQVSVEEVTKAIAVMKPTGFKGDIFTAEMIKRSLDVLGPIITKLVNLSFEGALVPLILKEAWITPLLKKAGLDPTDPLNYRPITNVSFLLKILDFIAHEQLKAHLENHKLLNPRQSGFRRGFGTETALLDLKNRLSGIIDSGNAALLLLLDLSAAFDLVDHSLLTQRLAHNFNFSKQASDWIASFLSGRTARVFIGDKSADPTPLVRGVPQGSCLSPTLYNMYTRPLFDVLDQIGVGYTNYADDTQIFFPLTGSYALDLAKMQDIFKVIQYWMAWNGLALNGDKTEILILGTKHKITNLAGDYNGFSIEGSIVKTSKSVKTLGIYLDDTLSMSKQVHKIRSTCAYITKLLYQIKPFLSKANIAQVAGALVNSRLDYCNSLLAGTEKKLIQALQVTQNNVVRAVTGTNRREHVSSARQELHWLPVQQRITHKICSLTHKCLHEKAPDYLKQCLVIHQPERTLRSNAVPRISPPRFKLATFGGRSFAAQAASHWNALPDDLKKTEDFNVFKKKVKSYLFPNIT